MLMHIPEVCGKLRDRETEVKTLGSYGHSREGQQSDTRDKAVWKPDERDGCSTQKEDCVWDYLGHLSKSLSLEWDVLGNSHPAGFHTGYLKDISGLLTPSVALNSLLSYTKQHLFSLA